MRDCGNRGNREHGAEGDIAPKRNIKDQIRVFVILPFQGDRQGSGHCGIEPGCYEDHVGSHRGNERNKPINCRA